MGIFDRIWKAAKKSSMPIDEDKLIDKSSISIVDKNETDCPECGHYINKEKNKYNPITINCYKCRGHNERNLAFMKDFMSSQGIYNFKCDECGTFIGVPENILCSECKLNTYENYQEIIDEYSKSHTIKSLTVRKGGCSECGISGYRSPVSLGLQCPSCRRTIRVDQHSIDNRMGVVVHCLNCFISIKIPPTVFCSVCGRLRDNAEKIIYKEFIKELDILIDRDPNDANKWYEKGIALKNLWRNAEADAAFAKANELGYNG